MFCDCVGNGSVVQVFRCDLNYIVAFYMHTILPCDL